MLQAKALYDNHSESSEELSFRSGDILTVVEKDVNGLEGWWLCYHGNKLGIAPGNRLKVIKKSAVHEDKDKTLTRDDSSWDYNKPSSINDNEHRNIEDNKVRDKTNTAADALYDLPAPVDRMNYLQHAAKTANNHNYTSSSTSNSNFTSSNPASSCGSSSPNRSSLLSMLSTGSSSLSDSARSSADVSFATYDTLPQCNSNRIPQRGLLKCEDNFFQISRGVRGTDRSANSIASCSSDDQRDSYLDDYSIPRNNNWDKNLVIVAPTNNVNNEFVNVADSRGFFEDLYDSPKRCLNANMSPPSSSSLSSPVKSSSTTLPTSSSFDDSTLKGYNKQVVDQLYDTPQLLTNQSNDLNNDIRPEANVETVRQNSVNPLNEQEGPTSNPNVSSVKQSNNKMSLPTSILPILSLQDDIKRYNHKLKCLVAERDDTVAITRMDDEFEQVTLKQSQIKLCCLSLKSAVKELIEFACNLKLDINVNDSGVDKNLHVQNIKDKIELLKCSLKEFEDKTNELLTYNIKKHNNNVNNSATSSGKKLNNRQFLQNLLITAGKLPLASDHLVTDVCSYFSASNVNIDKCNFTDNDISAPSPSKPKLPAPRVSNAQQNANIGRKSIQNRPLPAPPLNNFRMTTPHRPQQQIHYRYSSPGSNPLDINNSQQHLSCPGSINNNHNIGLPVLHSPKSTSQQLQHQHSTPSSSFLPQSHHNSAASLQRQHTVPQSNVQAFQQPDPMIGSDESDSLLVAFYASQIETHLVLVKKSASKFRKAMYNCSTKLLSHQFSQQLLPTPKEFVLRSKFVILAAHKLVYVADAIARNLADPTRYLDIAESANKLCNALKVAVNSTKESALQHEDVERRDFMVKSIHFVENASEELCEVIKRYKRPLDSDDDDNCEEAVNGCCSK